MTKRQQKTLQISYLLYYLIWALASYRVLVTHQSDKYLMIPVSAVTCFLIPLGLKIMHLRSTFEIVLVNLIFAAFASLGGTLLGFYAIPYFDKYLHFTSGVLMTMLSFMVYSYLKRSIQIPSKNEQQLVLLFINAMNMMIAVFWEFFEYACLIFLKNDAIHHYTSGVHDSMTDMLVAMVGGWILSGFVIRYFKTKRMNFWIGLNEHFFQKNIKK